MNDWANRAKELNKKIFMVTEWLYKNTELKKILDERGIKFDESITYHDACHAKKVQGIEQEPRELLKATLQ